MKLLHPVSEDEFVAVFLRGELDSSRYSEKLRALLARDGRADEILRRPNLADTSENHYRRQLLDEHRAYERREGCLGASPRRVDWFRAGLLADELLDYPPALSAAVGARAPLLRAGRSSRRARRAVRVWSVECVP